MTEQRNANRVSLRWGLLYALDSAGGAVHTDRLRSRSMLLQRAVVRLIVVTPVKIQRDRVDAIALDARLRTIGKNVAQMRVTACTEYFLSNHPAAQVLTGCDCAVHGWRPEARPTGTGIVFLAGGEQFVPTTDTVIHTGLFVADELAAERRLRTRLLGNSELLRRQTL